MSKIRARNLYSKLVAQQAEVKRTIKLLDETLEPYVTFRFGVVHTTDGMCLLNMDTTSLVPLSMRFEQIIAKKKGWTEELQDQYSI